MDVPYYQHTERPSHTDQLGNQVSGASLCSGVQILGNNFSAGGNNVINFNVGPNHDDIERRKCLQALFVSDPTDDREKYVSFKGQPFPQPFGWIMKSETYRSWANHGTGSNLLWLSGEAGMGKTMLTIFLSQVLEQQTAENSLVLYYFCEGRDPKRNVPVNILRGLIYTLVKKRPKLMKHLLPDFEVQADALFTPDAIEPLWRIFTDMIKDPIAGPIYCIIDALDECAPASLRHLEHLLHKFKDYFRNNAQLQGLSGDIAEQMSSLEVSPSLGPPQSDGSTTSPLFKVAIISRESPPCLPRLLSECKQLRLLKQKAAAKPQHVPTTGTDQKPQFHPNQSSEPLYELDSGAPPDLHQSVVPSDPIELDAQDQAVSIYIEEKTKQLAKSSGQTEQMRRTMSKRLRESGDGTFLWVNMAISQLKKNATKGSELAATNLPNGTGDMYCLELHQLPKEYDHIAIFILRWVAVAFRPLKLVELVAVWRFITDQDERSTTKSIHEVVAVCSSFLDLDKDQDIKLAHQTAKDILTDKNSPILAHDRLRRFYFDEEAVHGEIAQMCISYLESSCLMKTAVKVVSAGIDQWSEEKIEADHDILEDYPFLQYAILNWTTHMNKGKQGSVNMASLFFQPNSTLRKHWFESVWSALMLRSMSLVPYGQSLLHIIAFFDLIELAQYLSTQPHFKERIEVRNSEFFTPVFVAAARGSTQVMIFLLDYGANRTLEGDELLCYASRRGQVNSVQELIKYGWDVNVTQNNGDVFDWLSRTALRNSKLLHNLVSKTIDHEERDYHDLLREIDSGEHHSPLHLALGCGHEVTAGFLLYKGADVRFATNKKWEASHFAAWAGDENLIDLVQRYGGNPYAITQDGLTPLHCCALRGRTACAVHLLKLGLEVNAKTNNGRTPLHLAARNGHEEMVRVLIKHGANIEEKSKKGFTALHLASEGGRDDVVRALLENGADRNALTNAKETAFKLAKGGASSTTATLLQNPFEATPGAQVPLHGGGHTPALFYPATGSNENQDQQQESSNNSLLQPMKALRKLTSSVSTDMLRQTFSAVGFQQQLRQVSSTLGLREIEDSVSSTDLQQNPLLGSDLPTVGPNDGTFSPVHSPPTVNTSVSFGSSPGWMGNEAISPTSPTYVPGQDTSTVPYYGQMVPPTTQMEPRYFQEPPGLQATAPAPMFEPSPYALAGNARHNSTGQIVSCNTFSPRYRTESAPVSTSGPVPVPEEAMRSQMNQPILFPYSPPESPPQLAFTSFPNECDYGGTDYTAASAPSAIYGSPNPASVQPYYVSPTDSQTRPSQDVSTSPFTINVSENGQQAWPTGYFPAPPPQYP